MVGFRLAEYAGYCGLTNAEHNIVKTFYDGHRDYKYRLNQFLKSEANPSQAFRRFIYDVMTGEAKRPAGRKNMLNRDKRIFVHVKAFMQLHRVNLTSNRNSDGAAAIIAKQLNINEDQVIKAYNRVKKAGAVYVNLGNIDLSTKIDDDFFITKWTWYDATGTATHKTIDYF